MAKKLYKLDGRIETLAQLSSYRESQAKRSYYNGLERYESMMNQTRAVPRYQVWSNKRNKKPKAYFHTREAAEWYMQTHAKRSGWFIKVDSDTYVNFIEEELREQRYKAMNMTPERRLFDEMLKG